MFSTLSKIFFPLLILSIGLKAADTKTLAHIISIPIIEGAGIYSSIKVLQSDEVNSKAAGITNLSLLAVNGSLGVLTYFGKVGDYETMRNIHRIVGYAVTGAGVWMSISSAMDKSVQKSDKFIASGYTVLTAVPIIMFTF